MSEDMSRDEAEAFLDRTVAELREQLSDFDGDLQALLKQERRDKDRKTAKEAIRRERERRKERIEELAAEASVAEVKDALQEETFSTPELEQLLKREQQNRDRKTAVDAITRQLPQSHPARTAQQEESSSPAEPSEPAEPSKPVEPSEPREPQKPAPIREQEQSSARSIINGKRRWMPTLAAILLLVGAGLIMANGSLTGLFGAQDSPGAQDSTPQVDPAETGLANPSFEERTDDWQVSVSALDQMRWKYQADRFADDDWPNHGFRSLHIAGSIESDEELESAISQEFILPLDSTRITAVVKNNPLDSFGGAEATTAPKHRLALCWVEQGSTAQNCERTAWNDETGIHTISLSVPAEAQGTDATLRLQSRVNTQVDARFSYLWDKVELP